MEHEFLNTDRYRKFNNDDVLIAYSGDENASRLCSLSKNTILIIPSNKLFCKNYLKRGSVPEKIRGYNGAVSIYSEDNELYIKKELGDKKVVKTNVDLVSDIFFMLTRYEEVVNAEAAKHERFNRFPACGSIAFKNHLLDRPAADEHINLLWSFIDGFNLGYKKKRWWGDKCFAACLTHDVDDIQKFKRFKNLLRPTARLLKQGKPEIAVKSFFNYFKGYENDPYYTFDYIMGLEKHYGFSSSFYFMTGGASEHDNYYDINDEKVKKLITQIEDEGFEAGCHGSFNSYNNQKMLNEEKEKLDLLILKKPYGCRQHFLRFNAPYTWECQERAGLMYDATLGFADDAGFRCGTCFPFKPYDLLKNRTLDIYEIPLIVMDCTLQSKAYSGYSPTDGLEASKKLIDTVKRQNGVFTLLYHNSSFDCTDPTWDGWKMAFEETMQYLYENNCLGTSGREIINIMQ